MSEENKNNDNNQEDKGKDNASASNDIPSAPIKKEVIASKESDQIPDQTSATPETNFGNEIAIKSIFKEAWHLTKGHKGITWACIGILIGIGILVQLLGRVFIHINMSGVAMGLGVLIQLVDFVLVLGINYIMLRIALKKEVEVSNMFYFFQKRLGSALGLAVIILAAVFILSALMLGSGFAAHNIEPGTMQKFVFTPMFVAYGIVIFLLMPFFSAIYMAGAWIAEKNVSFGLAFKTSFTRVAKHYPKVLIIWVLSILCLIIGGLALLIGLIWALPLMHLVQGVMFRRLLADKL